MAWDKNALLQDNSNAKVVISNHFSTRDMSAQNPEDTLITLTSISWNFQFHSADLTNFIEFFLLIQNNARHFLYFCESQNYGNLSLIQFFKYMNMKKYSILLVCMAFTMAAMSQKAVINFNEKTHDFGKINEEDGKVTHVFTFTNKGSGPLVVNRVQASCGCTTPTWTKEPIEPGKSGSITVTYNPEGRPNSFNKSITVSSNATEEQVTLAIKGDVIPRKATDSNPYPLNMGGLLLKTKVIQMNNIEKGKTQVRSIEIQNSTKGNLKPTVEHLPSHLTATVTPETLKPFEEGKISFTLNSKNSTQWGPVTDDVYISLNGQKKYNDEFKISINSNIVDDFNSLTQDQKRKAPIFEMSSRTLELGIIKAGAKKSGKVKINNKGLNSLEIRRITHTNKEITVRPSKLSIGSGHSSDITVEVDTRNLTPGEYKKNLTLQTNDPQNSYVVIQVNWTIQK